MDQAPIGRTITLNPGFVDSLSQEQLDGYVEVLAEASAHHPDHDVAGLSQVIADGLHRYGITMAPVELQRTAEQLVGHGVAPLTISTADKVLFERGSRSALEPTNSQHVDPEDPDRPVFS